MKFNPEISPAIVAVISIITVSLPIFIGYEFPRIDSSALNKNLLEHDAHDVFIAFFVSTVPLFLDTLVDYFDGFKSMRDKIIWYSRMVIAIASVLVGIQLTLIQKFPSIFHITNNRGTSYLYSFSCLRIIVSNTLMLILCSINPNKFTPFLTTSIAFMISSSVILRTYCTGLSGIFSFATNIIQVIFLITIICILLWWYYPWLRKTDKFKPIDFKSILYLTIFSISVFASFVAFFKNFGGQNQEFTALDFTTSDLVASFSIYTMLLVFLTLTPSRISKYEAMAEMKNTLDTKKAYVQFISHELRTPLNTVFLGLKLSVDQIAEDTEDESELERRNTLLEMSSACNAALDILNELLLYDKLESGILVLNRLVVNVSDLVYESMKMFSVQVKEKNVELFLTNDSSTTLLDRFITTSSSRSYNSASSSSIDPYMNSFNIRPNTDNMILRTSPGENNTFRNGKNRPQQRSQDMTGIYEHDEINVDKNKIQQVIRNVISNAIKFTPEGGKIQVNMKFQPDIIGKRLSKIPLSPPVPPTSISITQSWMRIGNSSKIQPVDIGPNTLNNPSIDMRYPANSSIRTNNHLTSNSCILDIGYSVNSDKQVNNTNNISSFLPYSQTKNSSGNESVRSFDKGLSHKSARSGLDNNYSNSNNSSSISNREELSYISPPTPNNNVIKGKLVIEIYDTGAGISEENQQKLFNEIVQFNPELLQNGGGSGLGMWITRGIVDLHQGSINVYSPGEGKGSRFTLTLPMTRHVTLAQTNALLPDYILINSESAISHSMNPSRKAIPEIDEVSNNDSTESISLKAHDMLERQESHYHKTHMDGKEIGGELRHSSSDSMINTTSYSTTSDLRSIHNHTYINVHTSRQSRNFIPLKEDRRTSTVETVPSSESISDFTLPQYTTIQENMMLNSMKVNVLQQTHSLSDGTSSGSSSSSNKIETGRSSITLRSVDAFIDNISARPIGMMMIKGNSINSLEDRESHKSLRLTKKTLAFSTQTSPSMKIDSIQESTQEITRNSVSHKGPRNVRVQVEKTSNSHNSTPMKMRRKTFNTTFDTDIESGTTMKQMSSSNSTKNIHRRSTPLRGHSSKKFTVVNGYHLLIVDDSSMNRKMLVKLFTAQGYTCSEAKDGLEAYNAMKSILSTKSTKSMNTSSSGQQSSVGTCLPAGDVSNIHTNVSHSTDMITTTTTTTATATSNNITKNHASIDKKPNTKLSIAEISNTDDDGLDSPDTPPKTPHDIPSYYYDAILIDNQMPNMDGPTAAKKIRELGYTGIIIGVTGNAMPKDIEEFIQSGANRVLPKPLDMDKVNEIFQEYNLKDGVDGIS